MSLYNLEAPSEPYNPTLEHVAKTICGWVYRTRDGLVGILDAETDLQNLTVMKSDGSRHEVRGREVFNAPRVSNRSAVAKRRTYTDTHGEHPVERSVWEADPHELLGIMQTAEQGRWAA